jgi:hypothetical protein
MYQEGVGSTPSWFYESKTQYLVYNSLHRTDVPLSLVEVMITILEESWELTRREFRVFQGIPFRLDPAHVATFWVQVPDWMSEDPHLVDSEAGKAVEERVGRDFPELKRYGCTVELWTVYRRDFRTMESQYGFEETNGCRVWVAELVPDGLPLLQRTS